jgi:hypothetical protein
MDDRFSVRPGAVLMATGFEVGADVGVVVDFTVEHNPDRPILIGQRLLTSPEIDNAEPAVDKRGVSVAVEACFVRAAMGEDVAHRDSLRARIGRQAVDADEPSDTTHVYASQRRKRGSPTGITHVT